MTVLLTGGLAAWVVLPASSLRALWILGGVVAVALVLAGMALGRPALVAACLLVLGITYSVSLIARAAPLQLSAPLFGTGLLLCGELAWLSRELRVAPLESGLLALRLVRLAAVALAGLVVASLSLAAAAAPVARSPGLTAVGAAVVAAVIWLLAWRSRDEAADGG